MYIQSRIEFLKKEVISKNKIREADLSAIRRDIFRGKEENQMKKVFLVIGNWINKTTGKPMSGIAEITKGVNKQGQPYEIVNTDSREAPIEGTYAVGTILTANVQIVPETAPEATNKTSLKINSREQ